MADAENETQSGNLRLLQPLSLTHILSMEKHALVKSSYDIQTYLNNSSQLFADTLLSKFEDLTSKIVEKSPSRPKAKEKRCSKSRQSDDEKGSSEPSSK